MTPQDRPAQRDNPFARLDNRGHARRLGTTPAATGPTESVYTSLRITVERGKGYQAYRLFGSGSYVFFPCLGNTLIKPLVGETRPEDDLKINWRVKWFTDQHGHKTIMRVCDATSGEVLASTDTQPALLDVTVDESTGQLTTAKLDPFGKPFDPIRARMFQLVNAARGNECDYNWKFDTNVYPHDTQEYDMTMEQIAQKARDKQANEELQQTLEAAASADITPDPTTAPTRGELDAHFGPKVKEPHFSDQAEWWKKADKLFRKYREAAIIEHRRTAIENWFELPDMKQWDVMPEAALGLITAELDLRFGAKSNPKPTEPVKSVVPGYEPGKQIENAPKTNEKADSTNDLATTPVKPNVDAVAPSGKDSTEETKPADKPEEKKPEFIPAPILSEVKTLMGIPVGQLGQVLNRPYKPKAYKEIRAKNGDDKWTDLDPIAVRKRFDKVFGPQGFGWRIKPIEGVGRVEYASKMTTTREGKDRLMHVVSFVAFVFEYALVVNGKIEYVQTSAFSDSADNDDQGYAYRSAFTSLMKQALKMFGGFDHFADKTA